jgi:hypothetical protein
MSEILAANQVKEEGWYWMADKTDPMADWDMVFVCPEDAGEEDSPLVYGECEALCIENVGPEHVFLGPIVKPEVAIPFERLPVKLVYLEPPEAKETQTTRQVPEPVKLPPLPGSSE